MNLRGLLGIDLPILQAPMAGVQDHRLALAVAETGALGAVPCAMLGLDVLEKELAALKPTRRPINLNFFCHRTPAEDVAREARFRAALAPFYRELGIDPSAVAAGPGRVPFSAETAEALEAFAPRIVSFHFGLPSPELVRKLKSRGTLVLATATTVEEARWLEAHGADAIIAQGLEAGGHRGMFLTEDLSTQLGTFALVPQLAAAVSVPVIAAGGIADARGVSAALELGAAGVQVGTAFLLTPEATTSPIHRSALQGEAARHTAVTNLFTGRPARGVVNRLMRELGPMSDLTPAFPRATASVTPLRQAGERLGSGDFSPLWAGESAPLCKPASAAELVRALALGL